MKRIGIDAAFYILAFYSLDHIASNLGLSENLALIGVTVAALIEIFGTRVRYSGASFSYQVSGIFGGALAPIIATALYPTGGTLMISFYIAAVCVLSVLCYSLAAETYRKDIYEEEPQERRLVAEQQG